MNQLIFTEAEILDRIRRLTPEEVYRRRHDMDAPTEYTVKEWVELMEIEKEQEAIRQRSFEITRKLGHPVPDTEKWPMFGHGRRWFKTWTKTKGPPNEEQQLQHELWALGKRWDELYLQETAIRGVAFTRTQLLCEPEFTTESSGQ